MQHARSDYDNVQEITTNGTTRRIPADEPVFLIRGQDALGATVVRNWASLAARAGVAGDMVAAALEHADKMEAWPLKKLPDAPAAAVGSEGLPANQCEPLPLKSATSRDVQIGRLQAAIEGELEGLVCGDREADVILTYIETGMHIDEINGSTQGSPSVAVDALVTATEWKPTHRHIKRGTTYRVLGEGEVQVSTGDIQLTLEDGSVSKDGACRVLCDGDHLTVYQSESGKLWVRFPDEFDDGRFEAIGSGLHNDAGGTL